jgi:hypothetical protein
MGDSLKEKLDTEEVEKRWRMVQNKLPRAVAVKQDMPDDFDPESSYISVLPETKTHAPTQHFAELVKSFSPQIYVPLAWASSRYRSASVSDRVMFRLMNDQIPFVCDMGESNVFRLNKTVLAHYFQECAPFVKRSVMLVETSFASINQQAFPWPGDGSPVYRYVPEERPKRVFDQQTKNVIPQNITADSVALVNYVSPIGTCALPYSGSRLHAIACVQQLGLARDQGSAGKGPTGHGIVQMFGQWICSGEGTTRLFPWMLAGPYRLAYFSSVQTGAASLREWIDVMVALQDTPDESYRRGLIILTGMMATECAMLTRKGGRQATPPIKPEDQLYELQAFLASVWDDDRVTAFRDPFFRTIQANLGFLYKSFSDTIIYTVQEEFVCSVHSAVHDLVSSSSSNFEKTRLTIAEMRAVIVWIVQALIALVHLQGNGVNTVHGACTFNSMFLVPDEDPTVEYYHYSVPSSRIKDTWFDLYLPAVAYHGKNVHCALGKFDLAQSELHGVGIPGRTERWRDPLTLGYEEARYPVLTRMFAASYEERTGKKATLLRPKKKKAEEDPVVSLHVSDDEAKSDSEEEAEDDSMMQLLTQSTGTSAPSGDNAHDRVDFPSLNEVFIAIACGEWVLHEEHGDLHPRHINQTKVPLSLSSLTPSLILESAVITRYFQTPPTRATVHTFGKMAPLDHCPLQPSDLATTLTDAYRRANKSP